MKCPNCGLENPDDTVTCDCGYSLSAHRLYRSYEDMRIRDFFTGSWRTFGANWTTFLLLAIIPPVVSTVLSVAMLGVARTPNALIIALIITGVVSIGVWIVSTIALTVAAHKTSDGEAIGTWESFELSFGLFWRYVWTGILYFLIVLGGTFLFIIPGIIWAIRYVFAPYTVIIEGLSGQAALARSKALTQGRLFRTFLLEVGFGVLFFLAFLIPLALLTLMIGLLLGKPLIGFSEPKPEWAQAIDSFGRIISEGLFVIFNVLLFKSLRAMKMNKEVDGEAAHEADVATDLDTLAELYRTQGKYAEAERLQKRAREVREESPEPEHS